MPGNAPQNSRLAWHWIALLGLSALLTGALSLIRMPAAVLLGCMAAAALAGINGWRVRVAKPLFSAAQGVVGCMIARLIMPEAYVQILAAWPLLLASGLAVIATSTLLGWLLSRRQLLPGTTAMWGLAPGGATAVILLADAHGGDARLVALMQYLRIAMTTLMASLVSWFYITPAPPPSAIDWLAAPDWPAFAGTLAIIGLGIACARLARIPAGALLLPLVFSLLVQHSASLTLELPASLLVASFALIGWSIGLLFTPAVLGHCARALPAILLAVSLLIALCGALAWLLVRYAGVDPLTAYLATSPGGVDSVAIIAASTPVDLPFVMALQTVRFVLVIALGLLLAVLLSRYRRGKSGA